MIGPFPIFGRGHSGGRFLCEAFERNGFWMGSHLDDKFDTLEFNERVPLIRQSILHSYQYSELPGDARQKLMSSLHQFVDSYRQTCPDPERYTAFGWKMGFTIFLIEIFLDAFPDAKAIHLIRDGRDVMLSRLGRVAKLDDPLNRLMLMGNIMDPVFNGKPVTPSLVEKNRNHFELLHWKRSVEFGLRGRKYGDRYLEIKYESLCRDTESSLTKIFAFLGIPFSSECRAWSRTAGRTENIGKWRDSPSTLTETAEVADSLLAELGYTDAP